MSTLDSALLEVSFEALAKHKKNIDSLKQQVDTTIAAINEVETVLKSNIGELHSEIDIVSAGIHDKVAEAISMIPIPKDGKDGQSITGPEGKPGKDGKSIVGPKGKDGRDGKSIVGPAGKDGKSIKGKDGKAGPKGDDGVGIKDITSTQYTINIELTNGETKAIRLPTQRVQSNKGIVASSSSVDKSTVLKWVEELGGSTYTNYTPVSETLGGVLAGTAFDNVKVTEVLDMLLYPYKVPSFTSFSGISGPYEVGDTLPASTITMSWNTSSSANITDSSIDILDTTNNTILASSLVDDGSEDITISDITYTTPSQHTFTIQAVNTKGNTLSRKLKVNWYSGVFYGESALTDLTENDIEALRVKVLKNNSSGIYDLLGGNYKWICYPTSMGLKTTFKDISTNFDVAMDDVKTVSVTNSFNVVQDYYCHRTYNELGGDISIAIS